MHCFKGINVTFYFCNSRNETSRFRELSWKLSPMKAPLSESTVISLDHIISLVTSRNIYKVTFLIQILRIVTFGYFVTKAITRLADSYSVLDAIRRAGPILLDRCGRLLPVRGPYPRRERHRPSYDVLRRFFITLHQDVGDGAFDIRWRWRWGPLRRTSTWRQCAVV